MTTVHGSPQHALMSMEQQTNPNALDVAIEQGEYPRGYDNVTPVEVAGEVKVVSPAIGYPQCYQLSSANSVALILPHDPLRRNALILANDNDVYLCASKEAAQAVAGTTTGVAGFYLNKTILMAVPSKGAVWAATTTNSGTSRVSIFVARDE